ncbi:S9 family peptidase [bacterium]|nr:S9 family peptidase [bacterium]
MHKRWLGVLVVLLGSVSLGLVQDGEKSRLTSGCYQISIEDFFRNPQKTGYKLSPDGCYYAYRDPVDGIYNLFVTRIGQSEAVQLTHVTNRDIVTFFWGNNQNLLYLQDHDGDENYRLFCLNIDTKQVRCLTGFQNCKTTLIDLLENSPDEILVALNKRDPELFDPYRLNIKTGELTLLVENPGSIRRWIADNAGVIRIGYGQAMLYRTDCFSAFQEIFQPAADDLFKVIAFTPDNKNVYAYSSIDRDKVALVEYNLDTHSEECVLLEHALYDTFGDDERDHTVYDPVQKTLLYAQYTTEKRTYHFFDPKVGRLHDRLLHKIGPYELNFVSWTSDFGCVIVLASSDRVEGNYYLYDSRTDSLELLNQATPWLKEENMAPMQPISYTARDGLTIHGYLTLPLHSAREKVPLIVHPHAGPQWRNSWGFDARTQFFANRGYAVLQVNFRGSTGYGKSFLRAGFKQWGLKMQNDITDGVLWLIKQGLVDENRIAIFGWSFGGYAALAGAAFTPDLYKCCLDLWGITNYFTFYNGFPKYWQTYLAQIHERWGDPIKDEEQLRATSPVFHVAQIKIPVFIAQSSNDTRVKMSQSEQLVDELKKHNKEYEYYLIEGEGHAFTDEKKMIALMKRIEAFLQKHMQ